MKQWNGHSHKYCKHILTIFPFQQMLLFHLEKSRWTLLVDWCKRKTYNFIVAFLVCVNNWLSLLSNQYISWMHATGSIIKTVHFFSMSKAMWDSNARLLGERGNIHVRLIFSLYFFCLKLCNWIYEWCFSQAVRKINWMLECIDLLILNFSWNLRAVWKVKEGFADSNHNTH